jgi:phosphatidylinositol alpha-mannosyltransferase
VRRFADAEPLPGWPGPGGALGFVGRVDEPRKGLDVLLRAFVALRAERPDLRLLVAGPGDIEQPLPPGVTLLGQVSEAVKAQVYRSVDVFVAPNTGGESFGIILLEAMAAATPVVASDLDAFRLVLRDGLAGALAPVADPAGLADVCGALLDDAERRQALVAAGCATVARYDWSVVAVEVLRVYETAIAMHVGGVHEEPTPVTPSLAE